MGPDEDKNYTDPVIMHLNPETGEWEEVGKLKDVKEMIETRDVGGYISDVLKELKGDREYNITFDTGTSKRRYMVYELSLVYQMPESQFVYEISERYPHGLGSFLSKKGAIDCIAPTYGAVISMSSVRLRDIMANEGESVKNVMKMLRNFTPWYTPKIVDAFDVLDGQFNKVVILIKVR